MAKKDYGNSKIYAVRNNIDDDVYVGSTCQPLSKRMALHRSDSKKQKQKASLYTKMSEMGSEHFYIELFEEYPCDNHEQLLKREGEVIRDIGTLNHQIAGRSNKQHRNDNKEFIKEMDRKYRELNADKIKVQRKIYVDNNKDVIREKQKEYQINNRDKIHDKRKQYREGNVEQIKAWQSKKEVCECGSQYSLTNKSAHVKSKKHLLHLANCKCEPMGK